MGFCCLRHRPDMVTHITRAELTQLETNYDSSSDWELLDSKYLVNDRFLKLRINTFKMPSGKTVTPYYTFEYTAWANIVALTPDHKVVLVKQFRPGSGRSSFELPGGGLEKTDSSAHIAAERELLEETGFTCDRVIETGITYTNPASHTNLLHCFIGLNATHTHAQNLDATEDIAIFLIPLQDLLAAIQAGEIIFQSLHITALFFAQRYLATQKTPPTV